MLASFVNFEGSCIGNSRLVTSICAKGKHKDAQGKDALGTSCKDTQALCVGHWFLDHYAAQVLLTVDKQNPEPECDCVHNSSSSLPTSQSNHQAGDQPLASGGLPQ